jgi:hypothetical protein
MDGPADVLSVARQAPDAAAPGPGGAAPAARAAPPGRRETLLTAGALVVLCAVSVLLTRTGDMDMGFWIDEGLSVGISDRPLLDIPGVLRQDGSPPLYYMLLHLWMPVFGRSETATHALSLVFATACIPLAWWVCRQLFGTRAAWMAAVLAAFNPFLTQFGQETRMYTLVVVCGLLATAAWLAVFVLRRRAWLPAFVLALTAQLYTHNWTLFFATATGLALLVLLWLADGFERRALLRDALMAYGAVGLLYLPWVPSLLYQAAHTGAPWAKVPGPDLILDAFGRVLGIDAQYILLIAAGAGLAALLAPRGSGSWRMRLGPEGRAALSLVIIALGTFTVAWVSSQFSPAWALRYLAVGLPPALLLSVLGLARAGGVGLAGAAVVAIMWAFDPPPDAKSNAKPVANAIAPSLSPGDLVVSTQPEQIPVMAYYLPEGLRYATLWGPVQDIGITDWRDGVERIERTSAERHLEPLIERLEPGRRLVLVEPIIYDRERWSAPWTSLVRYRSLEWRRAAEADPRLRVVGYRPIGFRAPEPNPVAATVFLRVRG